MLPPKYLSDMFFQLLPPSVVFHTPPPGDRPYAGSLLGTFSLLQDVPEYRSSMSLSLGVVGPAALARQAHRRSSAANPTRHIGAALRGAAERVRMASI